MIGTLYIGADEGAFEAGTEGGTDEEVVDAPTHIPRANSGHGAPPGVMSAAGFELAESVDEPGLPARRETSPFLGRKAVMVGIGPGIRQVQFGVRHIEVTAEDDRFYLFKFLEVAEEITVPLAPVRESREFLPGIGNIDVHQEKVGVLGGDHAAFVVVLGAVHALSHNH